MMAPTRWPWLILASVLAMGLRIPAAQAQSGSVQALFEKYALLGTSAFDCGKPASSNNRYYVTRLLDSDHVQRDQMSGPTTRDWVVVLDKVREIKPGELVVNGTRDGHPAEGVWRVEKDRMLQIETTLAGNKLISGGRLLSTGREMPWIYFCDARWGQRSPLDQ